MNLAVIDTLFDFLPEPLTSGKIEVRKLGRQSYSPVFEAMKSYTRLRKQQPELGLIDQLWIVEHDPVYTLGQSTRQEHLPSSDTPGSTIDIVPIDRGGQITYHGPGQIVLYFLLNLSHRRQTVRWLISLMENIVIDLLAQYGIDAVARADAPGVYVNDAKIAAVGIRIQRGCSYHGLALNVSMDLSPFDWINPCGYQGMKVTQLSDLVSDCDMSLIQNQLIELVISRLH